MRSAQADVTTPEWLVVVGACSFLAVLVVSALWDAGIRWLHFFQAWMYVATIVLALRRNPWGYVACRQVR
jgi:hypothetical protein